LRDTVEKYCTAGQAADDNMAYAHTNTNSEYVTLIAFPQKQWLHQRVSVLLYTCIACLFAVFLEGTGLLDFSLWWIHEYTLSGRWTCFRSDIKNWGLTQFCPLAGADLNHRSASYRLVLFFNGKWGEFNNRRGCPV